MTQNKFSEMVFSESDLCDLIMRDHDVTTMLGVVVDPALDLPTLISEIQDPGSLLTWTFPEASDITVPEFHKNRQAHWFMPDQYRDLDIAEHVLSLCQSQAQLQRVAEELLLYQERDLFDLLRYLKYLVDIMRENRVIWGVGRGSSVASYVLYLMGVHRVDSLHYDLDPREFLR